MMEHEWKKEVNMLKHEFMQKRERNYALIESSAKVVNLKKDTLGKSNGSRKQD